MKSLLTILTSFILTLTFCFHANAQDTAWDRVEKIEKGYNLAGWLEAADWTPDFPNPTFYTEDDLILFAELGFKTVRVPILYEWIVIEYPPYDTILNQSVFDIIDNTIIPVADQYGMTVILDNHHGRELTDTNFEDEIPRICGMWKFLTEYYAHLPHDRYFFELRHQPGDIISNENLRTVQQAIIDTIRNYDTERTLIVGANWWSAPWSLAQTTPYNDDNIIYPFQTFDPFDFTHQGFSWTNPPNMPTGVTFSEGSQEADNLRNSLIDVKNWSQTYNVPIYWGEFGVSWHADADSRCNYIDFTTRLADSLNIPWLYWDIKHADGSFGIFDGGVNQDNIIPCFENAMELSHTPPVSLVLPGDFNNDNIVTVTDVLYMRQAEGNTGPARLNPTIDYVPQYAPDWGEDTYGVNNKHQDGNGDGIVDENDLEALRQNYGMGEGEDIQLEGTSNFNVIHRDTIIDGLQGHIYEIYIDVNSASGVSFRLDYGLFGTMQETVFIDAVNSWLMSNEDDAIWFHDTNLQRIDVAINSADNQEVENDELLPVAYIVTVGDVLKNKTLNKKEGRSFKVSNGATATPDTITGIRDWQYIPPKPDIDVYPNPVSSKSNISIRLREEKWTGEADLIIMDMYGKTITNKQVYINSGEVIDPTHGIPMNKLKSGIYLVRLKSEDWQSKPQKLMYLY